MVSVQNAKVVQNAKIVQNGKIVQNDRTGNKSMWLIRATWFNRTNWYQFKTMTNDYDSDSCWAHNKLIKGSQKKGVQKRLYAKTILYILFKRFC